MVLVPHNEMNKASIRIMVKLLTPTQSAQAIQDGMNTVLVPHNEINKASTRNMVKLLTSRTGLSPLSMVNWKGKASFPISKSNSGREKV